MKPIHILSNDETAGIICNELLVVFNRATWGLDIAENTKYLVTPLKKNADALRTDQIIRCAKNLQYFNKSQEITNDFKIQILENKQSPLELKNSEPIVEIKSLAAVTFGVTCHEAYLGNLKTCLEAIDAQTITPQEKYLVLDNCSFNTEQQKYVENNAWIVHTGNWKSPNPGRQWILDQAKTDWIMYADADDIHNHKYLEGALSKIEDYRVGIVHADRVGKDYKVITPEHTDYWGLRLQNYVDTSSLWRVCALREAGGWANTSRFDDWDCALRVTANGWQTIRNPVVSNCTTHEDNSNRNAYHNRDDLHKLNRSYAVVSLLAGREHCWEDFESVLSTTFFPKRTHFYFVDNSNRSDFALKILNLSKKLILRGFSVTIKQIPGTPPAGKDIANHVWVGNLYNYILPLVREDMLIFWEDDVIPMINNPLQKLLWDFDILTGGGISAAYPLRDDKRKVCASTSLDYWYDFPWMAQVRNKLATMGFIAGGLGIYHNALVQRALPFNVYRTTNGKILGWDWYVSKYIRNQNRSLILDGFVECDHRI